MSKQDLLLIVGGWLLIGYAKAAQDRTVSASMLAASGAQGPTLPIQWMTVIKGPLGFLGL